MTGWGWRGPGEVVEPVGVGEVPEVVELATTTEPAATTETAGTMGPAERLHGVATAAQVHRRVQGTVRRVPRRRPGHPARRAVVRGLGRPTLVARGLAGSRPGCGRGAPGAGYGGGGIAGVGVAVREWSAGIHDRARPRLQSLAAIGIDGPLGTTALAILRPPRHNSPRVVPTRGSDNTFPFLEALRSWLPKPFWRT